MAKCSNIHNIVLLRQTLRRWRSRAAARAAADDGAVSVPAGHVAVCVGGASRRFVVRAAHLNHPVFRELLRLAEEEYGFPSGACGPIALPCDEDHFRDVLRRVSSEERRSVSAVSSRDVATRPLLPRVAAEELVW
ncbi:indole-3-acetic acid-induced protein ARG7-like [Triticum urartu]|uniref:indole-3-acetic acid-induced protein ARG7-like n=1 Tax=Triticum urartu TaxID=4572 RepID=UPI00204433BE|nr:indole-3-acetic acid-induced protein ARG7-like [Triticum urartu]XP_048553513.1 indole-3-acetic acid-induced protein ARG7-like [Triticum urartu]